MTKEEVLTLVKGTPLYQTRFLPSCGISEVNDLHFMGYDDKNVTATNRKTKQRLLISNNHFDTIFLHRDDAVKALKAIEKEHHYQKKQFTIQLEDDDEGEE